MSCGVGHRGGLDPSLLWLWCRPAAVALIGPLVFKPPYAMGVDLNKQKTKKKKKRSILSKESLISLHRCNCEESGIYLSKCLLCTYIHLFFQNEIMHIALQISFIHLIVYHKHHSMSLCLYVDR